MLTALETTVEITAEKILRAEADYHEKISLIATARRIALREKSFIYRHRKTLIYVVNTLCALGVLLIIIDFTPYRSCKPNYLQDTLLLAFFVLTYVLLRNEETLTEKLWQKTNSLVVESLTERTFKVARRLIPFTALYSLNGKHVVYNRKKETTTTLNWTREASGEYFVGNDYIITYKTHKLYPDLFIFVDSPAALTHYFDTQGLSEIKI